MAAAIETIDDLRQQIALLKHQKHEQEQAIKLRFSGLKNTVDTLVGLLPHRDKPNADGTETHHDDWFTLVSRCILPAILNKTLFRKSNMLTKAVVALVSQQAANFINSETVTMLWSKIAPWLNKNANRKKRKQSPAL
jgi:hypothetical protein